MSSVYSFTGCGRLAIPRCRYARTMPAVPSGRSVMLSPPLSRNVYISFSTMSVVAPDAALKDARLFKGWRPDLAIVGQPRLAVHLGLDEGPVGRIFGEDVLSSAGSLKLRGGHC